jgi:hypothetical protein
LVGESAGCPEELFSGDVNIAAFTASAPLLSYALIASFLTFARASALALSNPHSFLTNSQ